MKTANERIADLEARLGQLEREKIGYVSAAYWASQAVLKSLLESKRIPYIEFRIAQENLERELTEALTGFPELLDHLKLYVFKARWRRNDV